MGIAGAVIGAVGGFIAIPFVVLLVTGAIIHPFICPTEPCNWRPESPVTEIVGVLGVLLYIISLIGGGYLGAVFIPW